MGSWSEWEVEHRMRRHGSNFVLEQDLVPGYYEYKFVVDGKWRSSDNAPVKKDTYRNNWVEVGEHIKTKLQAPHSKRSRPFSFRVNPCATLEETIARAKLVCYPKMKDEGGDGDFDLVCYPKRKDNDDDDFDLTLRDGTIISSSGDIDEDDSLFLVKRSQR
jgi:hypothetical protein